MRFNGSLTNTGQNYSRELSKQQVKCLHSLFISARLQGLLVLQFALIIQFEMKVALCTVVRIACFVSER